MKILIIEDDYPFKEGQVKEGIKEYNDEFLIDPRNQVILIPKRICKIINPDTTNIL